VKRLWVVGLLVTGYALAFGPTRAFAQGDEIQVYDGGLAPKGVFNLTWHNNFTPKGIKTPACTGCVTADRSFNGVTEWAYGASSWFEAGLYFPLYTYDKNLGLGYDGMKLRALVATPNAADRKVAFGLGFELGFNAKRWDSENLVSSEFRPIIAWHVNPKWDFVVNPIVNTGYDGFSEITFVPSSRLAYNTSSSWAVAVETYSDFGKISGFSRRGEQSHQVYGVIDHVAKNGLEVQFGAGVGLTDASDKFVLKMILAKDFNKPKIK
jgi:hypothetical protein